MSELLLFISAVILVCVVYIACFHSKNANGKMYIPFRNIYLEYTNRKKNGAQCHHHHCTHQRYQSQHCEYCVKEMQRQQQQRCCCYGEYYCGCKRNDDMNTTSTTTTAMKRDLFDNSSILNNTIIKNNQQQFHKGGGGGGAIKGKDGYDQRTMRYNNNNNKMFY